MIRTSLTLSFDSFWKWLKQHHNCILRAGTFEVAVYDNEDLHWHLESEDDGTRLVQVVRGKILAAEIVVEPERVAYVDVVREEGKQEAVFELVSEQEGEAIPEYFFVLAHGYEDADGEEARSRVH